MKKKSHIIYVAEDGIASLTCGVGAIANNFVTAFDAIADKMGLETETLRFSIISIIPKIGYVGIRPDIHKVSKEMCSKYDGEVHLLESLIGHGEDYFNFKIWQKYNDEANGIIDRIMDDDTDTVIISNDTIFAGIGSDRKNAKTVWIPNSLGTIHNQSYVDNDERYAWEKDNIRKLLENPRNHIGYVSDYVKTQFQSYFDIPDSRMVSFKNSFNMDLLKGYIYPEDEIEQKLIQRGIDTTKDIIFSFNRADEYKGLDHTLESMIRITDKHSNYQGIMIASKFSEEDFVAELQDRLKEINKDNKIMLSLGYEFELPKYILQSKLTRYLLNFPTSDFCPLVPFESEIIGNKDLCIMNSDIPCFQKLIEDGVDGFLAYPDVPSILKRFEEIENLHPEKRKEIISNGKKRSVSGFDMVEIYGDGLLYIMNA